MNIEDKNAEAFLNVKEQFSVLYIKMIIGFIRRSVIIFFIQISLTSPVKHSTILVRV